MKLAAIYNCWDSEELLSGSIKCIIDNVDLVIIVWQDVSNFGETYHPIFQPEVFHEKVSFIKFDPRPEIGGSMNERAKRNLGIDAARSKGCTNFLHIDCDEYYEDFGNAKEMYFNSGRAGSVVRLHTYFKKPTLRLDRPEDYFVPFIHRLSEKTVSGSSSYPFYVDPTRTVNESDVIELPVFMHHFSWVRKDIERKARNSSARDNIKNGTLLLDYYSGQVGSGFYIQDYQRKLIEVPDIFGLNPIFGTS